MNSLENKGSHELINIRTFARYAFEEHRQAEGFAQVYATEANIYQGCSDTDILACEVCESPKYTKNARTTVVRGIQDFCGGCNQLLRTCHIFISQYVAIITLCEF